MTAQLRWPVYQVWLRLCPQSFATLSDVRARRGRRSELCWSSVCLSFFLMLGFSALPLAGVLDLLQFMLVRDARMRPTLEDVQARWAAGGGPFRAQRGQRITHCDLLVCHVLVELVLNPWEWSAEDPEDKFPTVTHCPLHHAGWLPSAAAAGCGSRNTRAALLLRSAAAARAAASTSPCRSCSPPPAMRPLPRRPCPCPCWRRCRSRLS